MTLKIEFETGNSAFDDRSAEISRILMVIAKSIAGDNTAGSIRDYKGNRIGQYDIIGDE